MYPQRQHGTAVFGLCTQADVDLATVEFPPHYNMLHCYVSSARVTTHVDKTTNTLYTTSAQLVRTAHVVLHLDRRRRTAAAARSYTSLIYLQRGRELFVFFSRSDFIALGLDASRQGLRFRRILRTAHHHPHTSMKTIPSLPPRCHYERAPIATAR